jgi:hypothetical protein
MHKSTKLTGKSLRHIKNSKTKPCDVCSQPKILEEHHILGRKIPDYNKSWNLAYICSDCHTEVHKNLIIIEGWVNTTSGKTLMWYKNTK